jgi:nitrite reductase/ring-hydroxylating ferredoxin subunit
MKKCKCFEDLDDVSSTIYSDKKVNMSYSEITQVTDDRKVIVHGKGIMIDTPKKQIAILFNYCPHCGCKLAKKK